MTTLTPPPRSTRRVSLLDAPPGVFVRVAGVEGGETLHRRLLSMGFHKGDVVRVESRALFRGPLLVRKRDGDCRVALGRGVARKILVEAPE